MDYARRVLMATALLAALLAGGQGQAATVAVAGKKLLLKDKPKMVFISNDALVVPGTPGSSSDPRCVADGGSGSGASIELDDGTNTGARRRGRGAESAELQQLGRHGSTLPLFGPLRAPNRVGRGCLRDTHDWPGETML